MGLFTSVNESTWEHIKIALTPTLLWGLIDGFIYGENPNYFVAKCASLLIIIALMPTLYYGYKILIKREIFYLNILIFYIVIIASQLVFYILLKATGFPYIIRYLSCAGTFVIFGGYMIHTLLPAKSFIFKDPITDKYGYKGHTK